MRPRNFHLKASLRYGPSRNQGEWILQFLTDRRHEVSKENAVMESITLEPFRPSILGFDGD